jgi:hypothetical protein
MSNSFTTEENALESKRLMNLLDNGIRKELMKYKGVLHASVGLKIKNGQVIWKRCFHVYVDKKINRRLLQSHELIPEQIGGISTDIHEVPQGEFLMAVCSDGTRRETVTGGIQISNGYESLGGLSFVGTIGAIGKDNNACACRTLAITNWHVLYLAPPQPAGASRPHIRNSSRIFHPAATTTLNTTAFGQFSSIHWDETPDPNTIVNDIGKVLDGKIGPRADVGIFEINRSCSNCCGVPYDNTILGLETVSPIGFNGVQGTARAHTGDAVFFRGATSGPSKGYVVSDSAAVTITFNGDWNCDPRVTTGTDNRVRITFTDQLKIRTDGTHPCNKNAPKPPNYTGPDFSRFVDHGDSGSLLVNSNNMAVGLIFGSDAPLHATPPDADVYPVPTPDPPGVPPLPADCAPFTLYGYANHFDDVMDVVHNELNINFEIRYKINPASGSSGEAEVAPSPFEEKLAEWKERAEAHPFTSALYTALNTHKQEVLHLVNHCRPVTVVWQRNKGPAFVNSILNALNESEPSIPGQINGISLTTLAEKMYAVLLEQGSPALKTDLEKLGPTILNAIDQRNTVDEIFNALTL